MEHMLKRSIWCMRLIQPRAIVECRGPAFAEFLINFVMMLMGRSWFGSAENSVLWFLSMSPSISSPTSGAKQERCPSKTRRRSCAVRSEPNFRRTHESAAAVLERPVASMRLSTRAWSDSGVPRRKSLIYSAISHGKKVSGSEELSWEVVWMESIAFRRFDLSRSRS